MRAPGPGAGFPSCRSESWIEGERLHIGLVLSSGSQVGTGTVLSRGEVTGAWQYESRAHGELKGLSDLIWASLGGRNLHSSGAPALLARVTTQQELTALILDSGQAPPTGILVSKPRVSGWAGMSPGPPRVHD